MKKKRRTYQPRVVGGQIMLQADLERLHKYMLAIAGVADANGTSAQNRRHHCICVADCVASKIRRVANVVGGRMHAISARSRNSVPASIT